MKVVPVRHPWRWVAVAALAVLAAMFVHMLVTNSHFHWAFMVDNAFRPPVIDGLLRGTIAGTLIAMTIGVVLGVVVAVMRLSDNPVLSGTAWLFTWVFRAVPRVVLIVLFANLGILWKRLEFGLPFDHQLGALFGIHDFEARVFGIDAATALTGFVAGMLALGLSEAAYMAEIVRAGIQSVDEGQSEAAAALGMPKGRILRRIVLPQAMRVIVPPTGNETIAMLKDTSLLAYAPVIFELFYQLKAVGTASFDVFPMLVAAALYYLFIASLLMIVQAFLERKFGAGQRRSENTGLLKWRFGGNR
ncbi:amino acid ABC transporter permease [Longispora fulva]|nr:amino acid ABC transporter permease [Longispora fulva]